MSSRRKPKPAPAKVRADNFAQGPYFSQNAPTEVIEDGYRPDPSIHSTDVDPAKPEDAVPPAVEKTEIEKSDRNAVLTSPLPLVVSAPEAIDKMEALSDLIKEGRPDLAREAEAVDVALDALERKALGEQNFETNEAAEGHDPGTGLPGAPAVAFVVGDRVVMALDDGDYQGEIQKDNGDGTYDIKTDQMATFRRVPAGSIAKPDMLQPVASREPRMKKPPRRKAKPAEVQAELKPKAVKEGYNPVDGVKILEDNGKPRAFDPAKDDTVPAELYVNSEGKLALIGPNGEENYEEAANDDVEFDYWKQVHGLIPAPAAEKKPDAEAAPAPTPAPTEPAKEPVAAAATPTVKKAPRPRGTATAQVSAAAEKEATPAEKLLADHKVAAAEFWLVQKGAGCRQSDVAKLEAALAAGLKTDAVLGIFASKESADKFSKIVGEDKLAENLLNGVEEELENADDALMHTRMELGENGHLAKDAAEALAEDAEKAAQLAREAVEQIEASKVVASGVNSDLAKDPTFAMVLAGLKAAPDAQVEIVASKDGVVSARIKAASALDNLLDALGDFWGAQYMHDGYIELTKVPGLPAGYTVMATPWFNGDKEITVQLSKDVDGVWTITDDFGLNLPVPPEDTPTDEVAAAYKAALEGALPEIVAAAQANGGSAVEASAFDKIPDLEIGGGMTARRKKGKAEGKEEGAAIEVVDKDGKVVATYPDAFGDDTVLIIKFLRQVLDIKDADDKGASKPAGDGKGAKKEGGSAEEKPVVLPDAKGPKAPDEDKDGAEKKDKEKKELEAKAAWLENRIADCRQVVESMLRKGHVVASQADIDAELLLKKTLTQAQVVASRKAVDREVMRLLAKPEAELQIIKASLPHLKERLVKVQASEGSIDLAHLSAGGLIHEGPRKATTLGTALTAAFHR